MIIEPVDNIPDLFRVENVLPDELIERINQLPWLDHPWEEQDMQADWKRRKLLPYVGSPLSEVDTYFNSRFLTYVESVTKVVFEYKKAWSSFWLDYEGFSCSIHEDGAEREYNPLMAMQIYLTDSDYELGTVFYNDAQGTKIRYAFPYKRNTGYLMLNHPGHWHGMLNEVPAGHLRLSSYTYFGKFSHK